MCYQISAAGFDSNCRTERQTTRPQFHSHTHSIKTDFSLPSLVSCSSTPDRSNIFGSSLIDSKNLNYLIEKQSHLPRLSTSHLNSQVISDQLLSNYYAMSVATATNNSLPLHGQMAGPAKPQPRKKFTNDYSISLSKEENEYLFTLLGDRCVVSVARLRRAPRATVYEFRVRRTGNQLCGN